jgi:hypothetical protein
MGSSRRPPGGSPEFRSFPQFLQYVLFELSELVARRELAIRNRESSFQGIEDPGLGSVYDREGREENRLLPIAPEQATGRRSKSGLTWQMKHDEASLYRQNHRLATGTQTHLPGLGRHTR